MSAISEAVENVTDPSVTDDALAIRIGTQTLGADWRYVAPWNEWMLWNGNRWQADTKLYALTLTRKALREIAGDDTKLGSLKSKSRVAAVADLMRSNEGMAAEPKQWDADHWLLGTPGGTVDLRTGTLRAAKRDDFITKLTATTPEACPTPQWHSFLARIFRRQPNIIPFMQRVAGYALTGETREHKLIFAFGTGANGKSVFLNTLHGALGDYSTVAPTSTFLESGVESHPTDVASLQGARLVTANELPPGKAWNESRIKSLTGGDPITARRMRQDFTTFQPQFTLIIAGNHMPRFRGVDEAIRRRVLLVPFDEVITDAEMDLQLAEKLKAEWPGILQWALEGCALWQEFGLQPPPDVTMASAEYLDDEDVLGQFIEECLQARPDGYVIRGEVYRAYQSWTEACGGNPWTQKALTQALIERGLRPTRKMDSRGFSGYVLKHSTTPGSYRSASRGS